VQVREQRLRRPELSRSGCRSFEGVVPLKLARRYIADLDLKADDAAAPPITAGSPASEVISACFELTNHK